MYGSTKYETVKTRRIDDGEWLVLWERSEIGGVKRVGEEFIGYTGNSLFPDSCTNLPPVGALRKAAESVYVAHRRKK